MAQHENTSGAAVQIFKIIDPGHVYEMVNVGGHHQQDLSRLKFIKKVQDPTRPGELMPVHDGTTNEAVIAVLIHRMQYLNAQVPSIHNDIAIECLQLALSVLNKRTRDRLDRGVEGKHLN